MTIYSNKTLRLGNAGMRGFVGRGLDLSSGADFAAAFATLKSNGRILVGCDNRKSSGMFKAIVISSLLAGGCEVIDGGVINAGILHYLIKENKFDGGIMVSGGHQKAGWNSIIPFNSDGEYFNKIELRELFDVYHSGLFVYAPINEIKKLCYLETAEIDKFFDFLSSFLDTDAIRRAKFKVICDFCNGSGAYFAAKWAERFNLDLIEINNIRSGYLPRTPEPSADSGSTVSAIIEKLKCDAGFIFNSDMSRMSMVAENGTALSEELTFPLAEDYLLKTHPEIETVVTNICSSKSIDLIAKKYQRKVEKTQVGQSNIFDAMQRTGSILGGEGSGSFGFGKALRGFDGFFMAGIILEALAKERCKLSEKVAALPKFHMVKMNIESRQLHRYSKLRRLKGLFKEAEFSEYDGIRFDFSDGWFSLRIAGTEKLIRLISESENANLARERAWYVRDKIENIII